MFKRQSVGVIIPAAGGGVRIGGRIRKQFFEIGGKPIWLHAVERFHECPEIDFIVVAGPTDAVEEMKKRAAALGYSKLAAVVSGGKHRQDSVRHALEELRKRAPDLILVHDAVRPFVSRKVITDVLEACVVYQAAVPAVKVKETVKATNGESFVGTTPDRDLLWMVQTPQGFSASVFYEAFDRASRAHFYATDDSSLVERLGVKVKIVNGAYDNLKITTAEDLKFAEFLMRQ